MRILVFSDIHANLTALECIIADAGAIDAAWCLGDIVGYGPDPNECIERIQHLPHLSCIIGNHDAAVIEMIETEAFNHEAQRVIHWTQDSLTDGSIAFLKGLPHQQKFGNVTLVHGSPRQPVWEYLLDTHSAKVSFDYFDTDYCFVGHTHLPTLFHLNGDFSQPVAGLVPPNSTLQLTPRAIVNPGSVGQPRDRDPRAAYAIFDLESERWEHHRVAYDIASVQARMRKAGLPDRHIQRLSNGW
jgi:diadenosine tetraphosphatase ApaH/serine/threonine PP2A family protein phosphatase